MTITKNLNTKRLKIYVASQNAMEKFIEKQTVDVLKAAYKEMLTGALKHPEQWEWYAIWLIELKDGTHIGELCFKGLDSNGVAEIGYGIQKEYQGQGYATEAVKAISDWAFQQSHVTALEAETEDENIASKRVLEKCGFVPNGELGEEGPRYALARR